MVITRKTFLFCQTQIKDPCEAIKVHDLPQNLSLWTFWKICHRSSTFAKTHGTLPFIYVGFFHACAMNWHPKSCLILCPKIHEIRLFVEIQPHKRYLRFSIKHVGDLMMSWYVLWITFGSVSAHPQKPMGSWIDYWNIHLH